ncbi:CoB--CoM heterodisulfide reductase iron-sulfur subunit B family protein [Pseudodesulfovibrio sp. zrk46]|uniref:CoB--CoM heterodisulfide reductase iron-sulfur subunit B family protein n=1 Tax=Pseudodesulfovibrio sp. zrk46 TaxID=2725288 RepID=UPI001448FE4E|nr:CoB--CoM heterodisulfide reductase iron-sulfur subunit B family protein [Pseudodesulfovibrio sp. zrk46]QJB57435.1 heterodisulfide reductase subunit B [Pseudodesulfovibrio sp. zrk46]
MSSSLVYAYYPGCSGLGTSLEYDRSTRALCAALGIKLIDIPDWSCCGSTPAHTVDHTLSGALSARNIAQAESLDVQGIITPCPSCLTNLKTASYRMRDEGFKNKVNKLLDTPCRNDLPIMSVLQVLFEKVGPDAIKNKTTIPLKGIKVAPYYGCIMNRPPKIMNFDDCENPIAMDVLMEAAGAEVMPFPLKVECCGASYGVAKKEMVTTLSGKLLDMAADCGATSMVTACPLCQMNLDLRQSQVNRANKSHHEMPIFYYTQLLGMALGLNDEDLMLNKLCVSPNKVFYSLREPQRAEAS